MKSRIYILTLLLGVWSQWVLAQKIEVGAQYAMYEPSTFKGYTPLDQDPHPETLGTYHASAGKTAGTIPAMTVQITVNLSAEVVWTEEDFTIPQGWIIDKVNSDKHNLTFYNSAPWEDDDPYFKIPVRAIAPRTSTNFTSLTQVINIGGLWEDINPSNNYTETNVLVQESALPVTLIHFGANAEGGDVYLSWTTTAEENADKFEVQHSKDTKEWVTLGEKKAIGESLASVNQYRFTHSTPSEGQNYYRLKMIDRDGSYQYSQTRSIQWDRSEGITIYPNPTTSYFILDPTIELKELVLINQSGMPVATNKYQRTSANRVEVNALEAGLYLVQVESKVGTKYVHKLLIVK